MTHAEPADVLWFLPTHGDGRYLGTTQGAREVGCPTCARSPRRPTIWVISACCCRPAGRARTAGSQVALAPLTERLRFLVAVRPGLQTPSVAARMAATLDRFSDGRLLINVVTGGDPVELKGDGLFLDHAVRYEITAEFLRVWRRLMAGETVGTRGGTCGSRPGSCSTRRSKSPTRRSISAGPRTPGSRSPPSRSTST